MLLLAPSTVPGTGTGTGTGALAHTIHYGLVVAGLAGIAGILLPHLVQRGSAANGPRSGHEARIAHLRGLAAQGGLATLTPPPGMWAAPRVDLARTLWLPLALVGSTAAAGVHAAIGPPHLGALPTFGGFFLACALAQAGWSAALLLAPRRSLLRAGAVGNAALLLLWAASRTTGLPGVLPRPEPVGVWDLLCAAFEVGVLTACVVLLHRTRGFRDAPRVAPWLDWHPRAHLAVVVSVSGLLLAALSGAPA